MATALERDGFFYVTNTGIDAETINRQFAIGELTFDGVSLEEVFISFLILIFHL